MNKASAQSFYSASRRYGLALAFFAAGFFTRVAFQSVLGTALPYLTFFPATMLSAWVGGLGPGLLATVLGALGARYTAVEPFYSLRLVTATNTLIVIRFLAVGGVVSWLVHAVRRAQEETRGQIHRLIEETATRRRMQEALQASQDRLQMALDAANEGLWEWNGITGERFVSPRYHQILGFETGELPAVHQSWNDLTHPDDRIGVEKHRAEQIERQNGHFDIEYRMRKKDGEYIWVQSRGKVIEWTPEHVPVRIIGTITDITARRRLEEQFQQAQRLDSIGRLAGGVAHDFNNLLTVINGYAAMAAEDLPVEHSVREALQEIHNAGERAASLTKQLLAFSRKQLLQPTVVNLNHIVTDCGRMLERLIGEHISLVTKLEPDLGNLTADAGQLQQVIINLAVNSRDAMAKGGTLILETANVELNHDYTARRPEIPAGHYIMLAITDNGSGMTPEVQQRVFEPFFTTKPKGAGTGLGLATVHGIVRQTGGWIWVYSELGSGTTFKLYFPRNDSAVTVSRAAAKLNLQGTAAILIVEDQEDVRTLAVVALHRYGYTVYSAANAGEARAFFQSHEGPLALLLTDVVMPGGNGPELAAELRGLRPELKVLFMSGYTDNAIALNGMLDADVNYLQKPFTADTLAGKVAEVLGS